MNKFTDLLKSKMKKMNVLKSKAIAIICLIAILFTQNIFAQRGHHRMHFSEELQNELGLSDAQKEQIENIKLGFKEKFQALRNEETEAHSAKKMAMKALLEEQRATMNEVLTEEQQILLKEKRAEMKEKRKERHAKVDKKGLKTELEAYRNKNVKPVLLAQRAKLEKELSSADKETIAELRIAFEAKKAERKAAHKAKKKKAQKRDMEARKAKKEAMHNDEDRMALKTLVEKHETSINDLYAEIAPQKEQWKNDQKAIIEKYKSAAMEERSREFKKGKKGMRGKRGHKGQAMKKGAFLLLDPNQAVNDSKLESLTQIKIYPNPSTNSNVLDYTVKEAGRIKIEIHDAQGRLVKVLLDADKAPGNYQVNTDLSELKNKVYYYVVSDKQGISTKKFIIVNK